MQRSQDRTSLVYLCPVAGIEQLSNPDRLEAQRPLGHRQLQAAVDGGERRRNGKAGRCSQAVSSASAARRGWSPGATDHFASNFPASVSSHARAFVALSTMRSQRRTTIPQRAETVARSQLAASSGLENANLLSKAS